jgi:hypothetical protein
MLDNGRQDSGLQNSRVLPSHTRHGLFLTHQEPRAAMCLLTFLAQDTLQSALSTASLVEGLLCRLRSTFHRLGDWFTAST